MGWLDPASGTQQVNPAPETVDPRVQRALIESMLKRAAMLRANTPVDVNNQENMVSGRYVMPYGRMARMLLDPIVAGVQESGAISKLADLHKAEQANVEKALAGFPKTAEGGINLEDKAGLLKAAVAASQAAETNPVMGHILTQVVKNAIPSNDNPWATLAGALVNKQTGEVTVPQEITDAKQAEADKKFENQKELIRFRNELRPPDPMVSENRRLTNEKLKAEREALAYGKPLPQPIEKEVMGLATDLSNAKSVFSSFKPEYAGGLKKTAEKLLYNTLGDDAKIIDKNAPELGRWWQDYEKFQSLPERFAVFGATFTDSEKRSWENATINAKMSPEQIKDKLAIQMGILKNKTAAVRESMKVGGFNTKQVDAYLKQFGLIPRGTDYSNGDPVEESQLKAGDELSGNVWDGKQWVPAHKYTPEIDLGITSNPTAAPVERKFEVRKVQ